MRQLKWIAAVTLLVFLGVGVGAWTQRTALDVWWTVRGLSRADETNRAAWFASVQRIGQPIIEPLLEDLLSGEDLPAANALAALDHLMRTQGIDEPATSELVTGLVRQHSRLSPTRQTDVLRTMTGWMQERTLPAELIPTLARLLEETSKDDLAALLELAGVLLRQPEGQQAIVAIRSVAQAGLASSEASIRLAGIQLCLQPGVEMLEQVAGLLRDPSAEVRRAAILAVGPVNHVIGEDGLLPGLHDSDADVRRLTEATLRSRGVKPEHLELGRLLTHPRPTQRLRVLDHIGEVLDNEQPSAELEIDPGVWLRRLSHDTSPGVRAAALRLMSEQSLIDLSDRIDQMARSDPNPSISQLAQFYLSRKRRVQPRDN